MKDLKKQDLFCSRCYINGEWIDADNKSTVDVSNPGSGEYIGNVPDCGAEETKRAIDGAYAAWGPWKALTPKERGAYLLKWYDLIEENKHDLARILTIEQGKPLAEALGEVSIGASYIPWFAEEGKRAYGQVIPSSRAGIRPITQKAPVGVVFAITPWNFPTSLITRKIAPALAAGCPIIVKAALDTPFSALALAKLAEEAGIPKGIISVITGDAVPITKEVCQNSKVRKISFTGSTRVGKIIMEQASSTMKRLSLELGGNAPFIVFDDADLDLTIKCAVASKFRNAGQTCICANRFLIQKGIYDKFLAAFSAQFDALKVGYGLDSTSIIGPMINNTAIEKVERLLADAVKKGAKILIGGKRHSLGGLYFEPTLITGITREMNIFHEEIFGPVAAIMAFDSDEEAIELANDTHVGLASYMMTTSLGRSWRVSEALDYGMVGVNDAALAMGEVPFGGIKESGMGREGGQEGLLDYMVTHYILMGGI